MVVEALEERPVVGAAPFLGGLPALCVVGVTEPFAVGLVVVDLLPAGSERLDGEVVVECFPALNVAGAPPHAAVNVANTNPTSTSEAQVR